MLMELAPAATCSWSQNSHSRRGRHPEKAAQVTGEGSAQSKTTERLPVSKRAMPAAFLSHTHRVGWGMSVTNTRFSPSLQCPSEAFRCDQRSSNLACEGHIRSPLPSSDLVTSEPNYSLMRRLILKEIPWWKHTHAAIMASNKCKRCLPQEPR